MLTKAQRAVLEQALRDGNEIIMTGQDATIPRVRADVAGRLLVRGYLRRTAGHGHHLHERYEVTDAGKEAMAGGEEG